MATSIQQNIHTFLDDIRRIIDAARTNAVRSVDFCRVQMYWQMGQRILEEEQQGKDRADYGSYLIKNLAKQLQPEYGSGFSVRQLERCRQFYRLYPIASALRSQLNWTQYKILITISDPNKREYYELETVNNCWTAREMERQINSQLYERLLRCFVVVELKTGKLTHQDLGQLQMYVNYYDRMEKLPEENSTIGILLCTSKNDTAVRMALPKDNKTILASEYQLYLPTQAQLIDEVKSVWKMINKPSNSTEEEKEEKA